MLVRLILLFLSAAALGSVAYVAFASAAHAALRAVGVVQAGARRPALAKAIGAMGLVALGAGAAVALHGTDAAQLPAPSWPQAQTGGSYATGGGR